MDRISQLKNYLKEAKESGHLIVPIGIADLEFLVTTSFLQPLNEETRPRMPEDGMTREELSVKAPA